MIYFKDLEADKSKKNHQPILLLQQDLPLLLI